MYCIQHIVINNRKQVNNDYTTLYTRQCCVINCRNEGLLTDVNIEDCRGI